MSFEAEIKYNRENVEYLCKAVRKQFHFWSDFSLYLLSILLIGLGLYLGLNKAAGLIPVILGCLLLPNANYPKKQFTKKMLTFMEGWWPTVRYHISDDSIQVLTDKQKTTTSLKKIIYLKKDSDFYFLFDSKNSAFMIRRSSLRPNDTTAFETFISSKTGLKWKTTKKPIRFI